MSDLTTVVDWSRLQFAITAIYHWLFVPLTLGLSVIVAIMESIYLKTKSEKWLLATKFWMRLFGINFAIGVATGIILEFEFGTNWSNYSWFVGDIFGAPLAIEGILAFFMESTFVAVMFFGWNKVSPRFHLASTWLTALGASISALWILVANAWMQYPVGMEFDPDQMRNVMDNFWALFSGIAINKFFHAVLSGWALSGVFVIGVSCWFLWKKRNVEFAIRSIKVGAWFGLAGMLLTMYTGDGSAVEVTKHQPMKLHCCRISSLACLSVSSQSILCFPAHSYSFGIRDGIYRISLCIYVNTVDDVGDARNKRVHVMTSEYRQTFGNGDFKKILILVIVPFLVRVKGYGYFKSVNEAIPPVGLTFVMFRIMVVLGSYFLLFFIAVLFMVYRTTLLQRSSWIQWIAMVSVPFMWVCSEAGWAVAEVGRQPCAFLPIAILSA